MADKSRIEWTDATWTPIRARRRDTGKVGVHCERVSEACKNCYAATFNRRALPVHGTGLDFTVDNRDKVDVFVDEELLLQPLRWKRGRRIFVCSQTDLFGEFVTDEMIDKVFAVMALAPQHTFQVLTKRPQRMLEWTQPVGQVMRRDFVISKVARLLESIGRGGSIRNWPDWPLPNVWLGVTAENQARADERIPLLLQTPAAKRFVSIEPMLGPVDLRQVEWNQPDNRNHMDVLRGGLHHPIHGFMRYDMSKLDWVICGGESGPGARPMHPEWARSLRDQCVAAGVPFFFKQWGDLAPLDQLPQEHGIKKNSIGPERCRWVHEDGRVTGIGCGEQPGNLAVHVGKRAAGRLLDGREWSEFPAMRGTARLEVASE